MIERFAIKLCCFVIYAAIVIMDESVKLLCKISGDGDDRNGDSLGGGDTRGGGAVGGESDRKGGE